MSLQENISNNYKAFTIILGLLVAGASAGSWAYDIHRNVQSLSNRMDSRDFRTLESLRRTRGLSFEEWIQWCQLRQQFGGGPCGKFNPDPRTGRMK
jgi:hypothetical protein